MNLLRRSGPAGVHADVLRHCRAELVHRNHFHAVLEASKSVSAKIRERTGLTADGAELADQAFKLKTGMAPLAFTEPKVEFLLTEDDASTCWPRSPWFIVASTKQS